MITIAIADDHNLLRGGFVDIINDFPGCRIITEAADGQELIDNIAALDPKPDIAIIDIRMPVLDGYGTLSRLKKRYPSMKFLVLSGYDHEYCIIRMIQLGANGFVSKRCYRKDLYDAITTVYEHDYYYSDLASEKAFRVVKNNILPELTERDIEYICLAANSELNYVRIAAKMNISYRTVQSYQQIVGEKLNIHSRAGIAMFAVQSGLVPISTHFEGEINNQ